MYDYGYGEKIEYLTIRLPDTERNWCYSAEMLKAELNSLLVGQRIQAVCVSLEGCVYALYHAPDIIDLSYLGGSSLLLFEKTALELSFYAVGMLEYRLFPVWEAKLRRVYGYVPRESLPSDDLFIDASKEYKAGKNMNELTEEHIDAIVNMYTERKDVDKHARVVKIEEIIANDYNLNIPRYVDSFEEEEQIDINAETRKLKELDTKAKAVEEKLADYFRELGLEV